MISWFGFVFLTAQLGCLNVLVYYFAWNYFVTTLYPKRHRTYSSTFKSQTLSLKIPSQLPSDHNSIQKFIGLLFFLMSSAAFTSRCSSLGLVITASSLGESKQFRHSVKCRKLSKQYFLHLLHPEWNMFSWGKQWLGKMWKGTKTENNIVHHPTV